MKFDFESSYPSYPQIWLSELFSLTSNTSKEDLKILNKMYFQILQSPKRHAWHRVRESHMTGPMYWKVPLVHLWNTEDLKLSEDSKESRDEATQTHRGMEELYGVQCDSESRPTVRANLYLIWLLIGSQWRSKSKGMIDVGRFVALRIPSHVYKYTAEKQSSL